MMIKILSVGKIKEAYTEQAIQEYVKRLSRYCKIELSMVMDEKIAKNASLKEEEIIKNKEGEALLSLIKPSDYVVLIDLHGEEMSSTQFAEYMDAQMSKGTSTFTFVIGGSLGFGNNVIKRANKRIALSKMTFTHQMTKVIVLEQIYRSFKILNNEIYHK